MLNGVLDEGLKDELIDLKIVEGGIDIKGIFETFLITELLDKEVISNVFDLVLKGDDISSFRDGDTEETRQGHHHLRSLFLFSIVNQEDDRIEGIVEKVRVDLVLKGVEFGEALSVLFLDDVIGQSFDSKHHLVVVTGQILSLDGP